MKLPEFEDVGADADLPILVASSVAVAVLRANGAGKSHSLRFRILSIQFHF